MWKYCEPWRKRILILFEERNGSKKKINTSKNTTALCMFCGSTSLTLYCWNVRHIQLLPTRSTKAFLTSSMKIYWYSWTEQTGKKISKVNETKFDLKFYFNLMVSHPTKREFFFQRKFYSYSVNGKPLFFDIK